MGAATDEYRVRLEGRAELLEAARDRYALLVRALGAFRWEAQLRPHLALLGETRASLARVDEVLAAALRRAEAESWPARTPTVRCLHEVRSLREELAGCVARRLGRNPLASPGEPLGELLDVLEEWLRTAPRAVAPHQRQATALEALPDTLPALREAAALGGLLESLFAQPLRLAGGLPFSLAQRTELRQRWPEGEAALAFLWLRLAGVDPTGGLVEDLRKRALLAPRSPPGTAPERLLHAEYWYREAWVRLRLLAQARLAPLVPAESEFLEVAWWLLVREQGPEARLPTSATLGDARAGLFELAHELWEARLPETSDAARWTPERWARMEEQARRADSEGRGPEVERLRSLLSELIQSHAIGGVTLRGWREPSRLEGLVQQARALVG